MGLEYHLKCLDCDVDSPSIEFCIIEAPWVPKYGANAPTGEQYPEELPPIMDFLVQHTSHRISILDGHGKTTKPHQVNGMYVLTGERNKKYDEMRE